MAERPIEDVRAYECYLRARHEIYRVEVATGRRILWKELTPGDAAGVSGIQDIVVTPDGQSYFYGYHQVLCELFLVGGVK